MHRFVGDVLGWFSSLNHGTGRAREHNTRRCPKRKRLSHGGSSRSGRTVLGEVVPLPAPVGWDHFAPPTQASVSVRRKPRWKPKWGGKLLTYQKKDILFPLDLFLSLFVVQPHKHVSQCRTGDSDPHGPTTAEKLLDEPQPLVQLLLYPTQDLLTTNILHCCQVFYKQRALLCSRGRDTHLDRSQKAWAQMRLPGHSEPVLLRARLPRKGLQLAWCRKTCCSALRKIGVVL